MNRKVSLGIGFALLATMAQAQQIPNPTLSPDRLLVALPSQQSLQQFEITGKPEVVTSSAFQQVRLPARRQRDNAALSVEIRFATVPIDLRTIVPQERLSAMPPEVLGTLNQSKIGDMASHSEPKHLKKGVFSMTSWVGQARVRIHLMRPPQTSRPSVIAQGGVLRPAQPLAKDSDIYFVQNLVQRTISQLTVEGIAKPNE